jgi:hypothetical protein
MKCYSRSSPMPFFLTGVRLLIQLQSNKLCGRCAHFSGLPAAVLGMTGVCSLNHRYIDRSTQTILAEHLRLGLFRVFPVRCWAVGLFATRVSSSLSIRYISIPNKFLKQTIDSQVCRFPRSSVPTSLKRASFFLVFQE